MTEFNKNMEKIFDVTPKIIENEKTNSITTTNTIYGKPDLEQDLTDAYQQSRENLQSIIDQGKEAMDKILEISKQGQHPRSFEVYATLLKNMVDANKELLNIQKQMRDMDKKKETNNTNIDKAIFVGSTEELNKFLKNGNN
jgi:uncharacterized protein YukE